MSKPRKKVVNSTSPMNYLTSIKISTANRGTLSILTILSQKGQSQQDASLTEKVAALTEQNALLTNALHEIRTTGERQGNCEHDAALAEKVAILSAQNTSLTGYVATFANALHEIRTTRKR